MEHEESQYSIKHRRRALVTTNSPPPPSSRGGDGDWEGDSDEEDPLLTLSKPAGWLVQLVASVVELISTALLSISSPLLFGLFSKESKTAPSRIGVSALRRLTLGLLGAAYACGILLAAMVLAVFLGVALVRLCVEDPVSLHRPLHFDYTYAHPIAAVSLRGRRRAIPPSHNVRLSLALLLPDSDYNLQIGVFQITTEVISSRGNLVATSSQPCMLRFRSLPIRLMRTFFFSIPLLVSMSEETQKIDIEILRYKESKHKTDLIRVTLIPRAGTSDLPQIYEADMVINSQLPGRKELVYNWKWTFYVWISMYVYVMLIIILVCCLKPFGLPRLGRHETGQLQSEVATDRRYSHRGRGRESTDEFSDALKRWRDQTTGKRRVLSQHVYLPGLCEGSTSSPVGGETSEVIEDSGDFVASESSQCVG